jgi:hypothetical protein
MFARLKYQCSITLISLLEARKDNEIVNRMMKSLNVAAIKRNVSDIYYLYQEQYKEVYSPGIFKHYTCDPPEEGDESAQAYSSFIIETGFNLYIIYTIFLELKNENDGIVTNSEEKKELTFEDKFKMTSLGKLVGLVKNIILSLHDTALEMKRRAETALLGANSMDYSKLKDALESKRKILFRSAKKFF